MRMLVPRLTAADGSGRRVEDSGQRGADSGLRPKRHKVCARNILFVHKLFCCKQLCAQNTPFVHKLPPLNCAPKVGHKLLSYEE